MDARIQFQKFPTMLTYSRLPSPTTGTLPQQPTHPARLLAFLAAGACLLRNGCHACLIASPAVLASPLAQPH